MGTRNSYSSHTHQPALAYQIAPAHPAKRIGLVALVALLVILASLAFAPSQLAYADSGTVGSDVAWYLGDDGKLEIKLVPGKETGRLPNATSDAGCGENASQDSIKRTWPWHKYEGEESPITEVVIHEGVVAESELRHMFSRLPNLTKADLSGLTAAKTGVVNDMFRGDSSLVEVILPQDFAPQQLYRTFRDCAELTTIQFGTEAKPYDPMLASVRSGYGSAFNSNNMDALFTNCGKLTTLKAPGADLSKWEEEPKWTDRFNNFVTKFNDANQNPKTIDMPGAQVNAYLTARLFQKSTLGELYLQGATIKRNYLYSMFHENGGAPKLAKVDMAGISFIPERDGDIPNAYGLFAGLPALQEVTLTNANFGKIQRFHMMFDGCKALTKVVMNSVDDTSTQGVTEALNVGGAVRMDMMFRNCVALTDLDVSGFGKLDHIVTMQNFVQDCTALKILNISNMDNSRIKPVNSNHRAYDEDPGARACSTDKNKIDWNRNLALHTCPKLEWLIADGSKVWMTTNTKGNPDDQYFNAATELDGDGNDKFYYFTEKQMDLYAVKPADLTKPGTAIETIQTRRDYVDVMTDRTTLPDATGGPDYATNVNTKNGTRHINTAGAGFLAPVTYHVLGSDWATVTPPYQNTFYYIDKDALAASNPIAQVNHDDLNSGGPTITTKAKTHVEWTAGGNQYEISHNNGSPVITVTYPEAAKDVNGNAHDIVVKVNKITFTNLDKITDRPAGRNHDGNVYKSDCDDTYYRDVLTYGTGKLQFKNYARAHDTHKSIIKGDAGADIDFSIEVEDAEPNTSILFYIDDLDIPAWQGYAYPDNDACHDYLPWEYTSSNPLASPPNSATGVSYADHSEGVVLREGNDLDTLKFPDHNGLATDTKTVNGNGYTYIHGTGSDPSSTSDTNRGTTGWSAFSVKADASKSNYTWTNGIGCTTDILNPTPAPEPLDPVKIQPDYFKTVNNATPTGDYANDYFTFQLDAATEVTPVKYKASETAQEEELDNLAGNADWDENSLPVEKKNSARDIDFGTLQFSHPGAEGPQAFVYRIQEIVPNTVGDVISYNSEHVTYFMKVIVSNPSSDIEMDKGVKAEVTLGRHYSNVTDEEWKTRWDKKVNPDEIVWDSWSKTIWSQDASEKGERWQENRTIPFPQDSTAEEDQYEVKKDRNNVEYIAVPASKYPNAASTTGTVYLDANNPYVPADPTTHESPSILIETVQGDVYPYDKQAAEWKDDNHPDKKLSMLLIVEGKQVKEDVHGQRYIKDGSDYYAVRNNGQTWEKGSKLTVKDGTFNPSDAYDQDVEVDWMIDGNPVQVDAMGQRYYKAADNSYKDPGDDPYAPTATTLRVGKIGKVLPSSTDENVTHDKTAGAILVVTDAGGVGQVVYETAAHKLYYKKSDKYYSVMNTMLTPGVDGFDPDDADKPHETDFDIMVDKPAGQEPVYYYRSGKDQEGNPQYYQYAPDDPGKNGKPYTPQNPGSVDHTKIDGGIFNNKVRKANITIEKQAVDKDGNASVKSGTFEYTISFKNSTDVPIDINLDEFQFSPASAAGFEKVSTGTYKFTLDTGQKVVIYDIPLNTTYTINEPLSATQNNNGWEFVQVDSYQNFDPLNPSATPQPATPSHDREVTKKIITDADDLFYTHTFKNRFTEVLVDKITVDAPAKDKDLEFSFTATFSVGSGSPNQPFTYGILQQEEVMYKVGHYNASGEASVTETFKLKGGEDIALVAPQSTEVKVEETYSDDMKDYLTKVSGEDPTQDEQRGFAITLNGADAKNMPQPKLHFKNIYVPPVEKQLGVEKILEGRAWRNTDKFDMAVIPLDNAPLPDHAITKDDLVYLEAVVDPIDGEPVMDPADPTKLEGYEALFQKNEWRLGDFRKADGTYETQKTFEYNVRELTAAESSLPSIPGITYSSEEYRIQVTVELKDIDTDKPKLELKSFKVNKLIGTGSSAQLGPEVDIPVFTNVYDAHETTYKFEAVKDYADSDGNSLHSVMGQYKFVIKPFGRYETIAPMPMGKDVNGNTPGQTGEGREFVATNESDGDIEFRDASYTARDDGFRFNYDEIVARLVLHRMDEEGIPYAKAAAQIDAELHSDTGIDFEYEVYEIIPDAAAGETKVNNDDGTWSIIDDATGDEKIYDGIHHTRMIRIKVVDMDDGGTPDDPSDDVAGPILIVEGHGDDHKKDFYYDKDGAEQIAEDMIENYDEIHHIRTSDAHDHFDDGAPIFLNYAFDQEFAKLKLAKNWNDDSDRDKIRPGSVTMNVKSDRGIRVDRDITVSGTTWETTEDKLPVWRFDRQAYHAAMSILDDAQRAEAIKNARARILYTVTEKQESPITGDPKTAYQLDYYQVSTDPTKQIKQPVQVTLDPTSTDVLKVTVTNTHEPAPGKIGNDETYGPVNKPQTGKPNYKENPNNPVTPTGLVKPDKEGATISDDKKTVTIPGEGTYVLQDNGDIIFTPVKDFVGDPTPITVQGEDALGNVLTGTYTPHVVGGEEKTVTRTITYTYLTEDGETASATVTQTATLTRVPEEVDPKTGTVTKWGDWTFGPSSQTDSVDSPDIDGYTPDIAQVPKWTVDPADPKDETIHVVYNPIDPTGEPATSKDGQYDTSDQSGNTLQKQSGTPKFKLGTKKMPDGSDNAFTHTLVDKDGRTAETVVTDEGAYSINKETGEVTFTPAADFVGKAPGITVRGTDKFGNAADTTYTPIVVPNKETTELEREVTYTYWDKDGNPVTASKTQKLSFTRVGAYDPTLDDHPTQYGTPDDPQDSKLIVMGQWDPQDMPAVESPEDEGGWIAQGDAEAIQSLTPDNAAQKGFTNGKRTDNVPYLPQPPTGGNGETWGFPGEVQQKQGRDLFTLTTPKTAADDAGNRQDNEIVDIQLLDPDTGAYVAAGTPVNAYFQGQVVGTYHYDDSTGNVVFTPNKDFRAGADPEPATLKGVDKNGLSADVFYQPHFVPKYEDKTIERTITYLYDDNTPVLDKDGKAIVVTQPLTFKREAVSIDPNTHEPVWGPWTPASADMPEAVSPAADRAGYVPELDKVDAVKGLTEADDVSKAQKYPDVTVIYHKPPKAGEKKTFGPKGATQKGTPPFEKGSKELAGFTLIDPKTNKPTDKIVVEGQGTCTVDPKTGEVTFVPEEDFVGPATTVTVRGTDEAGETADGYYTPTVVDNTETVERVQKITYVYEDGTPVTGEDGKPLVAERPGTFTRTGTVNPDTGAVTWGDWTPVQLAQVDSPEVSGYTPDKKNVPSQTIAAPKDWPADDVVVYKKLPTYWVTYVDPDESIPPYLPKTYQPKGDPEPDAPADPTKAGYQFQGWDRSVDADGNVTYTAKWAELPKTYWVTYVDPDASIPPYLEKTYQPKGDPEPAAPADPTKIGFQFQGWDRSEDADGNVTYTAKWVERTYWVTYVDPATGRVIMDKTITPWGGAEPDAPADPERDGYDFAGWDRSVDELGNITYTAKWTPKQQPTPTPVNDKAPVKSLDEASTKFISRTHTITYTISQEVSADAESMTITDTLEGVLEFVSGQGDVKVTCNGQPVKATVTINGQTLTVQIDDATGLRGQTVLVEFQAKVRADANLAPYTKNGVAVIPNVATTMFNGDTNRIVKSNTVNVKIAVGSGSNPSPAKGATTTTTTTKTTTTSKTGDAAPLLLLSALALVGAGTAAFAYRRRALRK